MWALSALQLQGSVCEQAAIRHKGYHRAYGA